MEKFAVFVVVALAWGASGTALAQEGSADGGGPRDLVIVAGGDVAWPQGWLEATVVEARPRIFAALSPFLGRADLAFANIESPLSLSEQRAVKTYSLVMHPKRLQWMIDAGFNLFSLANNHTNDAGEGGVFDTIAAVERAREAGSVIWWSGAARRPAEVWAPTIFSPPGKSLKVAFLAFGEAQSALVPYPMAEKAVEAVRDAARRADFVIVSVHSGLEYVHVPRKREASRHRDFIDAGADVVLGHHPHVVQGVEVYGGGVIFHSLGNLSFASRTRRHQKTGALLYGMFPIIEIKDGRLDRVEVVPLYVNNAEPLRVGGAVLKADTVVPQVLDGAFAEHVSAAIVDWTGQVPGISLASVDALKISGGRVVIDWDEARRFDAEARAWRDRGQCRDLRGSSRRATSRRDPCELPRRAP